MSEDRALLIIYRGIPFSFQAPSPKRDGCVWGLPINPSHWDWTGAGGALERQEGNRTMSGVLGSYMFPAHLPKELGLETVWVTGLPV